VTFKGRVVHVNFAQDQRFEFGIRIDEIDNEDRIALTRFVMHRSREIRFGSSALAG
jgi:hypothetical protein